jgi:hypothetical protein
MEMHNDDRNILRDFITRASAQEVLEGKEDTIPKPGH